MKRCVVTIAVCGVVLATALGPAGCKRLEPKSVEEAAREGDRFVAPAAPDASARAAPPREEPADAGGASAETSKEDERALQEPPKWTPPTTPDTEGQKPFDDDALTEEDEDYGKEEEDE